MSIKNLRKSYANLTMLQRLALADNALGREDESEALAIKVASPRVSYTRPDFGELYEEILRMRMCNMVVRLGCIMNFDFLIQSENDSLINKSNVKRSKRINEDLKLASFLYVRATDAWNALNDELGLRRNFDEEVGENLFSIELFRSKDELLRSMAFSEDEAKAFVQKKTGINSFRTMEQEIIAYREALELDNF